MTVDRCSIVRQAQEKREKREAPPRAVRRGNSCHWAAARMISDGAQREPVSGARMVLRRHRAEEELRWACGGGSRGAAQGRLDVARGGVVKRGWCVRCRTHRFGGVVGRLRQPDLTSPHPPNPTDRGEDPQLLHPTPRTSAAVHARPNIMDQLHKTCPLLGLLCFGCAAVPAAAALGAPASLPVSEFWQLPLGAQRARAGSSVTLVFAQLRGS